MITLSQRGQEPSPGDCTVRPPQKSFCRAYLPKRRACILIPVASYDAPVLLVASMKPACSPVFPITLTYRSRASSPRARTKPLVSICPSLSTYRGRPSAERQRGGWGEWQGMALRGFTRAKEQLHARGPSCETCVCPWYSTERLPREACSVLLLEISKKRHGALAYSEEQRETSFCVRTPWGGQPSLTGPRAHTAGLGQAKLD